MTYVSVESRSKLAHSTPAKFPLRGRAGPLKHVLSAKAIDSDAVDDYCRLADAFEARSLSAPEAVGKTVALLFFQPSTRTRLGFESATVALGAHTIGMEDMSGSRTRAHGRTQESLEDCAAVVRARAMYRRALRTGAAAQWLPNPPPVINAGDGWNEHPTRPLSTSALRRGLGSIRQEHRDRGDPRGHGALAIHLLRLRPGERFARPRYPVPPMLSAITKSGAHHGRRHRGIDRCDASAVRHVEIGEPRRRATAQSDARQPHHHARRSAHRQTLFRAAATGDPPACDVLPNAVFRAGLSVHGGAPPVLSAS
jgi:hypothetical protein